LGIGDWGLGIGDPNPQSPIPNPQLSLLIKQVYINILLIISINNNILKTLK